MTTRRSLILLSLAAVAPLAGCALLEPREPVQVSVVGVEPLVELPVSISAFDIARQALRVAGWFRDPGGGPGGGYISSRFA